MKTLALLLLLTSALPLSAQSVSVEYGVPDNGSAITLYVLTSKGGNVLSYGSGKQWQYSGHTPFQAQIVTAPIPASQSSKNPSPAAPSTSTIYTSYTQGRTAFNKLP